MANIKELDKAGKCVLIIRGKLHEEDDDISFYSDTHDVPHVYIGHQMIDIGDLEDFLRNYDWFDKDKEYVVAIFEAGD